MINAMNDFLDKKSKAYLISKRITDIVLSSIGLLLLSPILIIVAIAIKIDSRGPIIFKQDRVGKDGKIFSMYKFRSMVVNAEELKQQLQSQNEMSGPMFKIKNDPRITKIGRFIRKTSIDELPQLLNVIKGDMSLVGPRPPLPSEVAEYSDYDKQRLYVTPGCTGLWQATERNEVGFNEMVQLDIQYIQRASFMFDLWIIWKTVKIIIKPNGSY